MGFLDTFYQDKLPSRAVTVYLYLRERSNKDGTCFPSIPTVSRDTGLSEATVKRAIQDLIAAGWLQKRTPSPKKRGKEQQSVSAEALKTGRGQQKGSCKKTTFLPRRNSAYPLTPAPVHGERGR